MNAPVDSGTHFALKVSGVRKEYVLGEETVVALDSVDLEVPIGDFVAIMGPSGSGKSTLLNQLGCLDQPTSGEYWIGGENVADLTDDELSAIRANRIGFVFQSYNLINQLTVLENIEMSLMYTGNESRATELASLVGMDERLKHRPTELSGGQQQRAGIARSLINDPDFILADEPTGNLDSHTTEEILQLFESLNAQGRTIVMVTHEEEVAQRARRIVRMRDGKIESDEVVRPIQKGDAEFKKQRNADSDMVSQQSGFLRSIGFGVKSLLRHPLRSLLTALGVFVGVASVIWLLAIGEGISQKAQTEISGLGANNIIVSSLRPPSRDRKGKPSYYSYGISAADAAKWESTIPGINKIFITREINSRYFSYKTQKRYGEVLGCQEDYRELQDLQVIRGRFLTREDVENNHMVCVLSTKVWKDLFPYEDPIGKQIHVTQHYFEVVGVVASKAELKDANRLGYKEDFTDNVYIPITTLWKRIFDLYGKGVSGSPMLTKAIVQVEDTNKVSSVAEVIRRTLQEDHQGLEDYKITVPFELMERAENARMLFMGMMGLIAGISLIVGGIGIMNIMLATVTERTREIGIRRALGARQSDITRQFLAETIVLSVVGGTVGILSGILCGPAYKFALEVATKLFPKMMESLPPSMVGMEPIVVGWSIPLSFAIAVTVGILFGIYPARKAAQMDPIQALRHVA